MLNKFPGFRVNCLIIFDFKRLNNTWYDMSYDMDKFRVEFLISFFREREIFLSSRTFSQQTLSSLTTWKWIEVEVMQ